MLIRVVDFAHSPGGRYIADGPYSGELFRERVLVPKLAEAKNKGEHLTVELDGTSGYAASFLEEAFGGLVRTGHFRKDELEKLLSVVARTPLYEPYEALADRFIQQAFKAAA